MKWDKKNKKKELKVEKIIDILNKYWYDLKLEVEIKKNMSVLGKAGCRNRILRNFFESLKKKKMEVLSKMAGVNRLSLLILFPKCK